MDKFGTMFPDVFKSLFRRPATENYPFVRSATVERLRGLLKWDASSCSGCGLCEMDCPAKAIQVSMLDRKAKRFFLTYHTDRCMFCGQCVVSCNKGSLHLSNTEWELASLDKASFLIYFGEKQDVEQPLAGVPEGQPEPVKQD
jgi:formate hydrogenlyase subunit 6/NADH:ubiquinone oxidoreductase subunit I